MQGNCTGPPPPISSPSLLQLKPGQCVLLFDQAPFGLERFTNRQKLLLSNLYLRYAPDNATERIFAGLMFITDDMKNTYMWLDNVTFQGNFWKGKGGGRGYSLGVHLLGGGTRIHASGKRI
jgi:hypothetical protein